MLRAGLALALVLIGGGNDLKEVDEALVLLSSSSPADRPFDYGGEGPMLQTPSESQVIVAAASLLDHARRGSTRALLALATARLFSTAIPRVWFIEHAGRFRVALTPADSRPAPVCTQLAIDGVFERGRSHVSVDLASPSGSVVALAVVACVVQSRLAATAQAAAALQKTLRQHSIEGTTTTSMLSADPDVSAWYAATLAEAEGRTAPADGRPKRRAAGAVHGEGEPDRDSQSAAQRALRVPWVRRFSLGREPPSQPSDAPQYTPITRDASLLDHLANEFADLINDSSNALTTLALLHFAAVRVEPGSRGALFDDNVLSPSMVRVEAPGAGIFPPWMTEAMSAVVDVLLTLWPASSSPLGSRGGHIDGTPASLLLGEGVFESDEAAYEALALAAFRAPGPASLALAYAAMRGLLPRSIAPPALRDDGNAVAASTNSDCMRAVWWVSALAEEVALEDGGGDSGLAQHEIIVPGLWERHEDALASVVDAEEVAGVEWLQQQAAEGDPAAHLELGELFLFGDAVVGARPDRAAAFRHFEAAAAHGMPEAQARLGALMLMGEGGSPSSGPNNATAARLLLERAADAGSVDALAVMGFMYRDGLEGGLPDTERALELLERAAELGSVAAHYGIAGILVEPGALANHTRAFEHFEIASDHGFSPAQVALADLLLGDESAAEEDDEAACQSALRLYIAVAEKSSTRRGIPSVVSAYKEARAGTPEALEAALFQYLSLTPLGLGPAMEDAAFLLLRAAKSQQSALTGAPSKLAAVLDLSRAAAQPLFVPSTALVLPPFPPDATASMQGDKYGVEPPQPSTGAPLSFRAAAYGLLLSAAGLESHEALAAVGDCISGRWRDVWWCSAGSESAASAAATAWYEAAIEQGSGRAAFALAMAYVGGGFGVNGPALPVNLTEAWSLLWLVNELDFLAEPAVFLGRAAVILRERLDAGGSGRLAALWGSLDLLYMCASGSVGSEQFGQQESSPGASTSDGLRSLRRELYGDACVFVSRVGVVAVGCTAVLLLAISAAVLVVTPAGDPHRRAAVHAAGIRPNP